MRPTNNAGTGDELACGVVHKIPNLDSLKRRVAGVPVPAAGESLAETRTTEPNISENRQNIYLIFINKTFVI